MICHAKGGYKHTCWGPIHWVTIYYDAHGEFETIRRRARSAVEYTYCEGAQKRTRLEGGMFVMGRHGFGMDQ